MIARIAVVVLAVAATVLPVPAPLVERWFSGWWYPRVQNTLTPLSNMVPIALLDIAAALWLVAFVVMGLARARRRGWRPAATRGAMTIVMSSAVLLIAFQVLWGLNYRRVPLSAKVDYEQNVLATYNLLDVMKMSLSCKSIVFASTSTVYGEARIIPTPESYGPLRPISLYGASKLACESLISGFSHTFGFRGAILRLANIVGPRSSHGIVYDFIRKLQSNPRVLEVLGDGRQSKSYLYIDDCINAFLLAAERMGTVEIYNVGSEDKIDVLSIGRIIADELGLGSVDFRCNGGVDGGRGWNGDVKDMLLDISKLKMLGWRARLRSSEAIRLAVGRLGERDFDAHSGIQNGGNKPRRLEQEANESMETQAK